MFSITIRDLFRDLFSKYRAITISVLVFLLIDLGVMGTNYYSSFKISESAVSINLSGRQGILSQRATKALFSLRINAFNAFRDKTQEGDLRELAVVVDLFNVTLKGFRDGDMVPGGDGNLVFLPQVETEEAQRIIADTYTIWTPYLEKLKPLLDGNKFTMEEFEEAVIYARSNNLRFLGLMNDLTSDLEYVANQRAERLRLIQVLGVIAALLNVLYAVFKAVSDLIRSDRMLLRAQKETTEILGTVKEGLFLLDHEYNIGAQYSASLSEVLRRDISPNMPFLSILESMVPPKVYGEASD
jgi:Collagenase and related proteases